MTFKIQKPQVRSKMNVPNNELMNTIVPVVMSAVNNIGFRLCIILLIPTFVNLIF